jgi:hypothetical protein
MMVRFRQQVPDKEKFRQLFQTTGWISEYGRIGKHVGMEPALRRQD